MTGLDERRAAAAVGWATYGSIAVGVLGGVAAYFAAFHGSWTGVGLFLGASAVLANALLR